MRCCTLAAITSFAVCRCSCCCLCPFPSIVLVSWLPGWAFLFLTQSAARQKRLNGRQDGTTTGTRRSPEWQARPVTKLLLDFGAQPALTRRDGPERFVRRVQRG